jgi:hypothetical protein
MKTNPPDRNYNALTSRLREWPMGATLPPGFRENVWRQIAHEETRPRTFAERLRRWLEAVLPRPKVAVAYVTVLLLIGMIAGQWTARTQSNRLEAALGWRYVQAVDPYQTRH